MESPISVPIFFLLRVLVSEFHVYTSMKKPFYPSDDRLARFIFQDPIRAAGLFREFVPANELQLMDLEKLVHIKFH